MKKSSFTEAETVYTLKKAEAGIPVRGVTRKCGVSEKTI